jgi:hypothetical protein
MEERKKNVAVIYNHVGPDEYEEIRNVDPATLGFKPIQEFDFSELPPNYPPSSATMRSGIRW